MARNGQSIRFLTQNELKALLDKAKRRSPRDYAMILLAYRHGLRASEVCNLTIDSVDLDGSGIRCQRGKGSITNWQRMESDEVKAVKAWLRKRQKSESPYLFLSRKGTPVSRSQFFRVFKALCATAGISSDKAHPHCLKHSLGSHLANAGVPVQVIQQRLGHRNIQNTMIYVQMSSGYVDRAVSAAMMAGAVV